MRTARITTLILGMNQKNQSLDTIWLEFASKLERFRILIGEKTYERCITIYMIYLRAIAILIESHQSNTYPNWRADVPLRRAVASLEDKELQGAMVDQSSSFVILCTLARSRLAGFLAAVMRGEELSELTHSKAIELASTQAITRSPREGDSGQQRTLAELVSPKGCEDTLQGCTNRHTRRLDLNGLEFPGRTDRESSSIGEVPHGRPTR